MKALVKFIVFSSFALGLTACVSTQPPQKIASMQMQSAAWKESGVIGYRDANQAFSASYVWYHTPTGYQIHLLGPFGAWRAEIVGNDQAVQLKLSDGHQYQDKSAEHLMKQHLGWSLPIQDLAYWLLGMSAPDSGKQLHYQSNGLLENLQQKAWTIHYLNYQRFTNYEIPSHLVLEQNAVKITLVVNEFVFSNLNK